MEYRDIVEERTEVCSVASKIVSFKIIRRVRRQAPLEEGEVVGFDCASNSTTCKSKCTYQLLLEDF
jgi:hypothetical protein